MNLKLLVNFAIVSVTSFITSVEAQASFVRVPTANSTIARGSTITVQVVRPNSIQGSREVGLAIGLLHCNANPCQADPISQMGLVLFTGQYNPVLHELPGEPYQNFSVVVPTGDFGGQTGSAQLGVVRLHLIGAGPSAILEERPVPVTVV